VTTEDEGSYSRQEPESGKSSRGFYQNTFSTSKYPVPLQRHVGKAPKISNFIFEEAAPERKDASQRRNNGRERREGR